MLVTVQCDYTGEDNETRVSLPMSKLNTNNSNG